MHRLLPAIFLTLTLLAACSDNELGTHEDRDGNTNPTMVTTNVNSFVSDSGITRYHLTSPVWYMYDEADEPYWLFPQGLYLEQFNDSMQVESTVVADTARYITRAKLWKLDGNVRMRNVDGDKFLTQQLFWDQNTHKVYSDSFVHIERTNRILEGYGFISNEQITAYTIRRPTGIFPTEDYNKNTPDSPTPQRHL